MFRCCLLLLGTLLWLTSSASAVIKIPVGGGDCDPTGSCGPGICGSFRDSAGCMNSCGTCPAGQLCTGNVCVTPCTPTTSCAAQGKNCGTIFDGCNTIACGTCQTGWSCSANVCQPPPPPDGEVLCNGTRVYSTADEPAIWDMLCGVGTLNGAPAVNWLGQWFLLTPNGLSGWTLTNGVGGVTPLSVAPADVDNSDTSTDPNIDVEYTIGTEVPRAPPPSPTLPTLRTRTFSFSINGRTFTVEGSQRIFDHAVTGQSNLRIRGDVVITLSTPEPTDGTTWSVTTTPERAMPNGSTSTVEPIAEADEAAGNGSIGNTNTLFSQRNVIFAPTVDLVGATRTTPPRATQAVAQSSAVMNAAGANLFAPGQLYALFQDQALNVNGSVLSASGTGTISYDKQRLAQFFMSTRDSSGFSDQGADRPLIDAAQTQWTFRQPITHYSAYFPFLAGICGMVVNVDSFLQASFQADANTSCFDGIYTNASATGSVSFSLSAAGGFGCNIIVASASAGLQSTVSETLEFGTSVSADPPSLNGFVRLYTEFDYDAFFKVRVLFWSHKWTKHIDHTRVFQKELDSNLAPDLNDGIDLCAYIDQPEDGTCADPNASCDASGTCVRYDLFSGPSGTEPERVELGDCTYFNPPRPRTNCATVPASVANLLDANTCYLTFDDGPSPNTPRYLTALSSRNIKATHFLIGSQVAGSESVVRQERDMGDLVGNHQFTHQKILDVTTFGNDVVHARTVLDNALGAPHPRLFRFPEGSCDAARNAKVIALGYPDGGIGWSVDSLDWCYARHGKNHCGRNDVPAGLHDDYVGYFVDQMKKLSKTQKCVVLFHENHTNTIDNFDALLKGITTPGWTIGGTLRSQALQSP